MVSRNPARILLLLLFATQCPIFLQQTLTPDAVMFDLQAKCVLEGGVLYRDIVEPNLPGVVWLHAAIRSLAGWSSITLRAADLILATLVFRYLAGVAAGASHGHTNARDSGSPARSAQHGTANHLLILMVLLVCYLGCLEWCHCQRDLWMLLPAAAAIHVRSRWLGDRCDLQNVATPRFDALVGLFEGCLWAIGLWIKPFIAVPAISVMVLSGWMFHCRRLPCRQAFLRHTLGVLAGGLIVGGLGISWMVASGCWSWFLDMALNWNGQYYRSGRARWTLQRVLMHVSHFQPWFWLHVPALVLSFRRILSLRHVRVNDLETSNLRADSAGQAVSGTAMTLLCAAYPAWLVQACLFQQLFDYVYVPCVVLAIVICAQQVCQWSAGPERRSIAILSGAGFLVLVLLTTPLLRMSRIVTWKSCVAGLAGTPVSAEVRDAISLSPLPRWKELEPLVNYLKRQSPADREVLAHSCFLIYLYPELRLHPPTRYVYLDVLARLFPDRREEMLEAVVNSETRWVVADLMESGWDQPLPENDLLPENLPRAHFPWNQVPMYRSGGYVVFQRQDPPGKISDRQSPLRSSGN